MKKLGEYTKAVVGAVVGTSSVFYVVNADGHVTQDEWVTLGFAFVLQLAAIWGVPNVAAKVKAVKGADVPVLPVDDTL